jgi:hypothetical protein
VLGDTRIFYHEYDTYAGIAILQSIAIPEVVYDGCINAMQLRMDWIMMMIAVSKIMINLHRNTTEVEVAGLTLYFPL